MCVCVAFSFSLLLLWLEDICQLVVAVTLATDQTRRRKKKRQIFPDDIFDIIRTKSWETYYSPFDKFSIIGYWRCEIDGTNWFAYERRLMPCITNERKKELRARSMETKSDSVCGRPFSGNINNFWYNDDDYITARRINNRKPLFVAVVWIFEAQCMQFS